MPPEDDMATPKTPTQPPLIREGSQVFAAIAAAALLVGGLAGISRGGESHGAPLPSDLAASATDHHGEEHAAAVGGASGHPHDETAPGVQGHNGMAHPHKAAPGQSAAGATTAASHDHAAGTEPASSTAGHGTHDDAGSHGDGGGHAGHDPGVAAGDHHHATGCADDHPTTLGLVGEVQGELATTYKDIAALVALGYHPYFDSLVPGGYPPGGEGISHWINPNYIDDGVVLDPQRPETILLDDWYWPIGMMFINDPGVAPVPVYVNDDGTACSPWHPHTDAPARFGWYYYRAVYDRSMEGEVPAQTPEMMHVWAIPNPAGVYAAHDYPPREERAGAPGPVPSYFSEVTIPGS
jgi:hypothetical protein